MSEARTAARSQIHKYFLQLTSGCSKTECDNIHCASSSRFAHSVKDANSAAALALTLYRDQAQLCAPIQKGESAGTSTLMVLDNIGDGCIEPSPENDRGEASSVRELLNDRGEASSVRELSNPSNPVADDLGHGPPSCKNGEVVTEKMDCSVVDDDEKDVDTAADGNDSGDKSESEPQGLTLDEVTDVVELCKQDKKWSRLIHLIGSVYNSAATLKKAFLKQPRPSSKLIQPDNGEVTVNLSDVRNAYKLMLSANENVVIGAFVTAFNSLRTDLAVQYIYHRQLSQDMDFLNPILIALEMPLLDSPEFLHSAFPLLCNAFSMLPFEAQAKVVRVWSLYDVARLRRLLERLQQLITVVVVNGDWQPSNSSDADPPNCVNTNRDVTCAVKVMRAVYYASLCGGELESEEMLDAEKQSVSLLKQKWQEMAEVDGSPGRSSVQMGHLEIDGLAKALGLVTLDCVEPLLPSHLFVNETLNEVIEIERDYIYFKARRTEPDKFTFATHHFVLNTATKSMIMYYDNRVHMIHEHRSAIMYNIFQMGGVTPNLRLNIRRTHLVTDTLINLEMVYTENPADLRKQLYVEFEGEPGVDEGGVSKEFFQLIVEELFNPDIGMFVLDEQTRLFWFNPGSLESDKQFTLVGIVLGLAIYNHIILDLHLPPVLYRKLMGKLGCVRDLKHTHPDIYRSLSDMLAYEGDLGDLMTYFSVSKKNVFGEVETFDLCHGGSEKQVTQENKQEFADLYANFLLNKQVENQFAAFSRGFHLVVDGSPLEYLFSPTEIEVLVCGSTDWDFHALQNSTEYDSGYTADSPTIKEFWAIAHAMSSEEKRLLLQFTTGSDRVPVGGLSKLKMVIARNGPDTDRLPTAHTCFNVLLLPQYATKEKLKDRLLKAISYSKGFGMI